MAKWWVVSPGWLLAVREMADWDLWRICTIVMRSAGCLIGRCFSSENQGMVSRSSVLFSRAGQQGGLSLLTFYFRIGVYYYMYGKCLKILWKVPGGNMLKEPTEGNLKH